MGVADYNSSPLSRTAELLTIILHAPCGASFALLGCHRAFNRTHHSLEPVREPTE